MTALLLFVSFIIFMLVRVPIGFSLGLACLVTIFYTGSVSPQYLVQGLVTSADSFPLMAIPFYILAGEVMAQGGISKRLFGFAKIFVGNITGGLAIATVITCIFFAAISGSGPATVAAIGGMVIPLMVKHGYDKKFATAIIVAAGTIGVIIPPSIPMVIYGVSASASIGDMFLSGIIPGLIVGLLLILYSYFYSKLHNYEKDVETFSFKRLGNEFKEAAWSLAMPVIILGGIYGGVFTPTEAAVVATVYGLIIGVFVYRELNLSKLYNVFKVSSLTTAVILIITGTATFFGRILSIENIPEMVATALTSLSDNRTVLLLLIILFLLFVGTFMDVIASIIILTPILLPVATEIGIDPIHFGIILVVSLAIALITPPIGGSLFVGIGISRLSIWELSKAIVPMFFLMILALVIVAFLPQVNLLLP
ncbi:C4-dicarboxylate transporter, DctM subunit [Gracilibacillus orientalis]|uniref:C4-dicarboxylate transporter, DctM subunit n=1 Tax=Gracilibacillus orientalis TaxID=334253 RepID=A0A1I4GV02_9BACI|nr:TRAP transporter large permease [Gracilibacillus orientalis]SFL33273.1 C4-dicarboxylate transporter, DctM subunit [Gracilibacillus orientalis]